MVLLWMVDAQQQAGRHAPVAKRFNGIYTPGGNFRRSHLNLPYRGYDLVIELHAANSSRPAFCARLEMDKPNLPELSLITNSILKKSLDIEEENRTLTGDERFDFLFQVVCEDADLAGKIFSKDVRDNLKSELLHMPKFDMESDHFEMTASFSPASFSRQKYDQSLEHFIETVLSVLDSAWK